MASGRIAEPPQSGPLPVRTAGLPAVGDAAVLAEEVADLTAADADVPGGHVGVLTDVARQLGHEGLAEPHHLGVRAAVRVEVAAALAAADAEPGQRVLEDLLEAEELHDAEVDRGVEAEPALVRAERAVELDPEPAVDVDAPPVVLPRHPEDDLPLGLDQPLDQAGLGVLGPGRQHRGQALQHLPDGLVELRLGRIAALGLGEELGELVLGVVTGHRGSLLARGPVAGTGPRSPGAGSGRRLVRAGARTGTPGGCARRRCLAQCWGHRPRKDGDPLRP